MHLDLSRIYATLRLPLTIVLLFAVVPLHVFSQGAQTQFGQNRVQYKNFEWSFYESDNFKTYYYLGGQDIGKYTIQYAEKTVGEIEEKLEYQVKKRIQIMVYNDISDLNQTNIGMDREVYNTGGVTKTLENKMFVYFNGDHADLEKQIRQGIARIMLEHMMFGGNLQEILQNAVLLNLPTWYTDGLVSYIGESWSTEMDNRLKDGILSGKFKKFNNLTGEDASFAGHAIWHYVEQKYGRSAVPNLLYLTRINRSLESGFLFVLGGSVKNIQEEWYEYYYSQFTLENEHFEVLDPEAVVKKRDRPKWQHYSAGISPDGNKVAYVINEMGKHCVILRDREEGTKKRIYRGGLKTQTLETNYAYPLLAFSPDNKFLAVIYEKRDKVYLLTYDLEEKKKEVKPITKFQQITSFSYYRDDPRFLIMSAVNRGQTDIYSYYLPTTRVEQLTNDYHDDLDPAYVNIDGRRGIIFSSNRPSEELSKEPLDTVLVGKDYDLFFYDLDKNTHTTLTRLTNSPFYDEQQAIQYNDEYFSFLSNDNGIYNRYTGYFKQVLDRYDTIAYFPDSTVTNPTWDLEALQQTENNGLDSVVIREVFKDVGVTYPATNFNTSIVEHDIASKANVSLNLVREDGRFRLYVYPLKEEPTLEASPVLKNTFYQNYYLSYMQSKLKAEEAAKVQEEINDEGQPVEEDTVVKEKDFFFQSDFNTAPEVYVNETFEMEDALELDPIFKSTRVLPYKVKFSTEYITSQIDNSLLMTRYEKFTPGSPVFNNPPLSAMINLGISDLFEDFRITGGLRFPFNFSDSEYFLAFENFKKRLDKKWMYYRKVEQETYSDQIPFTDVVLTQFDRPVEAKRKTNYFEYSMSYPLDVMRSFRLAMAYRHENYVFQALDELSLNLPNHNESWLFAKFEFVHDNTINTGLNLMNGTRFKIYAEIHKQFSIEKDTIFNNLKVKLPNFDNSYLGVVGIDFRHYQKVHKEIIWANRVAWASSYGTQKLIYYLGGVDNWIAPKFDDSTPVNENNNYQFQTLATNMRGFDQNVRNGNSFIVINSELRIPVFDYFIKTPIKSEFIKNFQIIGFTDVGTAWEGINPYDDENPLFTEEIGQPPVTVNVEYFKNPIVAGYGFGLRTSLFGYFIRFDVAWGNDSGQTTEKPKLYFSLSLDF